jgi:alanine racemase
MPVKETTVEIKLKNLKNNLEYLKSKITSKTKFMAVVKAFSYGSDSRVVSEELERLGVNYLAVAYTQEGDGFKKGLELKFLFLFYILKKKILII